jgi:hypothetical protein
VEALRLNGRPGFGHDKVNFIIINRKLNFMEHKPNNLRILMEMRPALDGFYGIPQETRLLYGVLARLPDVELSGLLQMSKRSVRGGVYGHKSLSEAERVHRFARVVVALKGRTAVDWKGDVAEWLENLIQSWRLRGKAWMGLGAIPLGHFETRYFRDYVGRNYMGVVCLQRIGRRCCAGIIGFVLTLGAACIWWVLNAPSFLWRPAIRV